MSKPSRGDTVTVWEVVLVRRSVAHAGTPTLLSRVGVCKGRSVRFESDTYVDRLAFGGPICNYRGSWSVDALAYSEQDAIDRWTSECADKVKDAERALLAARKLAAAEIVRPEVDRG